MKDPNVNYDRLRQSKYNDDTGEYIFYSCPICGGEYLDTFIVSEDGKTMCIDCWNKRYG